MDGIIQFVESIVRSIMSAIEPLFSGSSLGYIVPIVVLGLATLFAVLSKNRVSLGGYTLGWIVGLGLIGVYLQADGDDFFERLTGNIPQGNIFVPALIGLGLGFVALLPFYRNRLSNMTPFLVGYAAALAVFMLFLTYRAGASINATSTGLEALEVYRRRYVGFIALGFGTGMLAHIVLSAANPPPPPPPPPKPPAGA